MTEHHAVTTIRLPEFATVFCPWADDYVTSRDGFCGACGKRGHEQLAVRP